MPISVALATYNGQKYIKAQLDSILCQLEVDDEIIICDDSSTDATVEIIESVDDARIKLFKNQTFASHVYNFEHALKQAQHDYLFLCDQDDIWLPNKRTVMLHHLQHYDLVLSDAKVVDQNLAPLEESFFVFNRSQKGLFKNLYKNSYLGCCMAFHRHILHHALPFPRDINMHDWWIGMIAQLYGSIYFCDEKLLLYRRHHDALTPMSRQSTNPLLKKIGFRVTMLKGLLMRYFFQKSPYER
jgi:glycosyltransferase involved in cell wall biosynthesis